MNVVTDNLGKVSVTVEKDYWDINKSYDKLTVVEDLGTSTAYLSRKPVPPNINIFNREYWIKFGVGSGGSVITLAQELGYRTNVAVSQKAITDAIDALNEQLQLLARAIGENVIINFTVSPESVFVGEDTTVLFNVTSSFPTTSISIEDENCDVIPNGSGSGSTFECSYNMNRATKGDYTFTARVVVLGIEKTVTLTIPVNMITISQLKVTPSNIYQNEASVVTFTGIASRAARLEILDENNAIIHYVENSTTISYQHTLQESTLGFVPFKLKAIKGNEFILSDTINVLVVESLYAYFGGGATYNDVVIEANKTRNYGKIDASNPTRSYTISNAANEYLWFIIPDGTTIRSITSNGFGFAYDEPVRTLIGDKYYNVYRSHYSFVDPTTWPIDITYN